MDTAPEFCIRLAEPGDLDQLVALERLLSYDLVSRQSFRRMTGSKPAEIRVAASTQHQPVLGNFILFTRCGGLRGGVFASLAPDDSFHHPCLAWDAAPPRRGCPAGRFSRPHR